MAQVWRVSPHTGRRHLIEVPALCSFLDCTEPTAMVVQPWTATYCAGHWTQWKAFADRTASWVEAFAIGMCWSVPIVA